MNPTNTVHTIKRLLGMKYSQVKDEIARLPCKVIQGKNDEILIQVKYLDKEHIFTPVQIMAMLLHHLVQIIENESGQKGVDAVISVPAYYLDSQKRALVDACRIAGLCVIRLINDTVASATLYGIYRETLPEQPKNVALVDVGYAGTEISICSVSKDHVKVLTCAYDAFAGGRYIDEALFNHFVKAIKEKYNLDVMSNPKAKIRLLAQCGSLKKILSANTKGELNIECLMEDTDVRFTFTRKELEEMCQDLFQRFEPLVNTALQNVGLTKDQIESVEIIGGSCYVPAIKAAVSAAFGKPTMTTMNAQECVAKGCALVVCKFSLLMETLLGCNE